IAGRRGRRRSASSWPAPRVEVPAQALARLVQPSPHRSFRDVERARHLDAAHALEVAQREHDAKLARQLFDAAPQTSQLLLLSRLLVRAGALLRFRERGEVRHRRATADLAARVLARDIEGNPDDPGAHRCPGVKMLGRSLHFDEGRLYEVVQIPAVDVARANQNPMDAVDMTLEQ